MEFTLCLPAVRSPGYHRLRPEAKDLVRSGSALNLRQSPLGLSQVQDVGDALLSEPLSLGNLCWLPRARCLLLQLSLL